MLTSIESNDEFWETSTTSLSELFASTISSFSTAILGEGGASFPLLFFFLEEWDMLGTEAIKFVWAVK
jgi:hypothetical protein